MISYINGGGNCPCQPPGANCQAPSNTPPTVDAGANYAIPRATPFSLTGTASDPNGDSITYTWEEYDLGPVSPPDIDADGQSRPIFRSLPGTTNPTRTIPALNQILNSANVPPTNLFSGTSAAQYLTAETLPIITRTMTFQVTARDNRSGGGGISSDNMQLNVTSSAGPFYVTQPNTSVNWTPGLPATVTWNVANTTAPPVNCSTVKISLSTDGGATFPPALVVSSATANDGAETITVPTNATSTQARIKVEAVGNIFFDISDTNFIIPAGSCSYSITPLLRNVGSQQVSKSFSVATTTGCGWLAKSNAPWITISSGSGSGSGSVSYVVQANVNGAFRTGTISVAGKTHTVNQDPSGTHSFSINPSSDLYGLSGGNGRIDVITSTTGNWAASSNIPWIAIISGSAGTGSRSVLYTVALNNSGGPRMGTLTIAGFLAYQAITKRYRQGARQ